MTKNHEVSVYFSTKVILALATHHHYPKNPICAGFQMKDAFESKDVNSCNVVLLMSDEDKTFSGSLVLDQILRV